MKRNSLTILPLLAMLVISSCTRQDDIYKQYVVPGGYNYPAKPTEVTFAPGLGRVEISWALPIDPAVKSAKLTWDNGEQSIDIDYANAVDGRISQMVENLEERSYSFNVINYDAEGNKSLASEIIASPYGDGWLSTHAERRIVSSKIVDGNAVFITGPATYEMVATKFCYLDNSGNAVVSDELPWDENELVAPDALKGKKFWYKSAYRPQGGLDVVWSKNWIQPNNILVYKIDGSQWDVKCTNKQTRSSAYGPEKIFDGIVSLENSYYSSTTNALRTQFPKVISVDTMVAEPEKAFTITEFVLVQNEIPSYQYAKTVEYYVGSTHYFDPNSTKDYLDEERVARVTHIQDASAQYQPVAIDEPVPGRYFALVFKNAFGTGAINIWELEPWGYIASEIENSMKVDDNN